MMNSINSSVRKEVAKGSILAFVLGCLLLIGIGFLTLGRGYSVPLFLLIPFIAAIIGAVLGFLSAKRMYITITIVIILFFIAIFLFSPTLGRIITQQFQNIK